MLHTQCIISIIIIIIIIIYYVNIFIVVAYFAKYVPKLFGFLSEFHLY